MIDYNWEVYGITCPKSGEVVYVGVTNNGKRRRKDHRKEARKGTKTPLYDWIRSLTDCGHEFGYIVLDSGVGISQAGESERRWIAHFASTTRLLNKTSGGEFMCNVDAFAMTLGNANASDPSGVSCSTTQPELFTTQTLHRKP